MISELMKMFSYHCFLQNILCDIRIDKAIEFRESIETEKNFSLPELCCAYKNLIYMVSV